MFFLNKIVAPGAQTRVLKYPPHYILLKLNQFKHKCLEGLEEGVIPVKQIRKSFKV